MIKYIFYHLLMILLFFISKFQQLFSVNILLRNSSLVWIDFLITFRFYKRYILKRYGEQPKLSNSLFHDEKYSRFSYLPTGKVLLNVYIDYIKKNKFNHCYKLLLLQIKNLFFTYPPNLILRENQFKSIEEYSIKQLNYLWIYTQ